MDAKNGGVKEGNHRLQDSGLFGIIENTVAKSKADESGETYLVSLNHKAKKQALAVLLEAECRKAQAITYLNWNSYR